MRNNAFFKNCCQQNPGVHVSLIPLLRVVSSDWIWSQHTQENLQTFHWSKRDQRQCLCLENMDGSLSLYSPGVAVMYDNVGCSLDQTQCFTARSRNEKNICIKLSGCHEAKLLRKMIMKMNIYIYIFFLCFLLCVLFNYQHLSWDAGTDNFLSMCLLVCQTVSKISH